MKWSSTSEFYNLSVVLTGFNIVKLKGTGQGDLYYSTLLEILGEDLVKSLLTEFRKLNDLNETGSTGLATTVQEELLESEKWGPVCRNIIKMWYMGYWYQMPQEWRENFISSVQDCTKVISAQSYVESLVWDAIGQHPQSAKQPGFGTWAFAPESINRI